jgi:AcrR family transcriptional regulator
MNIGSLYEDTLTLRGRFKTATRDAILEAAAAAFASEGPTHVRMEDIAARAGIAVGTLYNYFQDRSALVGALLEVRTLPLLAALDAAVSADTAFQARLMRFVEVLADHFETNQALLSVLLDEQRSHGHDARTAEHRQSVFQEVVRRGERLLSEGVRGRALRDADPALYAALLVGMVRGMALTVLAGGDVRVSDAAPTIVDVFLRGASR